MRKLPDLTLDRDQPQRRRWRYTGVLTVLLGLAIAPVVYESSLLVAAQWRGLYGAVPPVHTPVLDLISGVLAEARLELTEVTTPLRRAFPWKPSVVVPCVIVWTAVAAYFLRRD